MLKKYKCVNGFPGCAKWSILEFRPARDNPEGFDLYVVVEDGHDTHKKFIIAEVEDNEEYFEHFRELWLWRAGYGDKYRFVADYDLEVQEETDCRSTSDDNLFLSGNYYRSREDAVAVLDCRKLKVELQNEYGYDGAWDITILERARLDKLCELQEQAEKNRFITTER